MVSTERRLPANDQFGIMASSMTAEIVHQNPKFRTPTLPGFNRRTPSVTVELSKAAMLPSTTGIGVKGRVN